MEVARSGSSRLAVEQAIALHEKHVGAVQANTAR
jgi:hypothetical protein